MGAIFVFLGCSAIGVAGATSVIAWSTMLFLSSFMSINSSSFEALVKVKLFSEELGDEPVEPSRNVVCGVPQSIQLQGRIQKTCFWIPPWLKV